MLCERCNKNQANISYRQTMNGKQTEYHICSECAKELNIFQPIINSIVGGFLNAFTTSDEPAKTVQKKSIVCPNCSSDLESIVKTGKLGCACCYDTFSDYLGGVFKRIQPGAVHTGKIPKKSGEELRKKKEVKDLKSKLDKAIEKEEYEEAAKLRDMIRALQKEEG